MKSPKYRSNHKPGMCMKTDCSNEGKLCVICVRFDRYVPEPPKPLNGSPVDPDNLGAIG